MVAGSPVTMHFSPSHISPGRNPRISPTPQCSLIFYSNSWLLASNLSSGILANPPTFFMIWSTSYSVLQIVTCSLWNFFAFSCRRPLYSVRIPGSFSINSSNLTSCFPSFPRSRVVKTHLLSFKSRGPSSMRIGIPRTSQK